MRYELHWRGLLLNMNTRVLYGCKVLWILDVQLLR